MKYEVPIEDDSQIDPECVTRIFKTSKEKPTVVFFHGFTSCPRQFLELGEMVYKAGYNVMIPRLPYHGYKDKNTRAQGKLTVRDLIAVIEHNLEKAHELGSDVIVAGLSGGGVMTAYAGLTSSTIKGSILISPVYSIPKVPIPLLGVVSRVLLTIPDKYIWWSPTQRENANFPPSSYKKFSVHASMAFINLSRKVFKLSKKRKPNVETVYMVLNENDMGTDLNAIQFINNMWKKNEQVIARYEFPKELGLPHNLVSADHPAAKIDVVYPKIVEIIKSISEKN